jgi:hypothetical protein
MSWREQEDLFDQINAAAERGARHGRSELKGEMYGYLIALRAGILSPQQFIEKIEHVIKTKD